LLKVLVFATAMVGVRIALRPLGKAQELPPVPESHLLTQAADLLMGPIAVFALYLAASGHLGPGGGFPAGAILGSGLLLLGIAQGMERLSRNIHERRLERLEYGVVGMLILGGLGAALAGPPGSPWFITANLLIGLEVAIGAWVILHRFTAHRGEL
jgi:multicomponent Na+:H+ antiporter subunit B